MPVGVAVEGATVRVDVPEPVTLVGLRVAVKAGEAAAVRETVPEKPPSPLIVIELVAELGHVVAVIEVGLALIVKS